ncbi:GNAT family N-acetyltransferase [Amycolatopsis acidiphila]|uniref:GNAT family N-acetyltransferase n=1 Tax=Amycolatopsis acidiphila TaxID=715473 RepID=A0A557ZY61_9PSEU|nr:GNAT family N-acetyltransferase [Amycolatopsis acidiphila]TVT16940.1 GNAT family N-acetyltransferase [Amycolatopsis acidiphila]UIJ62109.1 GNAT family N-acetyltransferase [Amycolatopsis acidiphila]
MTTVEVRAAVAADAPEIARIQRVTWRTAYADFLGEKALAQLDAAAEEQWAVAIEHPGTTVHVATEGAFTVGFCVAGPAPDEEVAGASGELPEDAARTGLIATLLVEPRWGRRGHGGRLLAEAATGLRQRGAERGISWVAESDSASLSFFRRAGWLPDGTVRTLDTGERRLREIRLTGQLELELVG